MGDRLNGFQIINSEIQLQAYGKYLLLILMALNYLYEPAIPALCILSLCYLQGK